MFTIKKIMGLQGNFSKSPLPLQMTKKKKFLNMQLENLRPQRNIENNGKKSDKIYQINMIDDKESDERDKIGKNKEETQDTYIEVLKLRKLSLQKNIDYLEKESDERNRMDMSDDRKSDEKYQIGKNDEEKVNEDIEVLKMGKLSLQKIQTILKKNLMKEIGRI